MYLYIYFFQPERAKKSLLNERREKVAGNVELKVHFNHAESG